MPGRRGAHGNIARTALVAAARIEQCILLVRGQKVMLDSDLATLYGVETRVLIHTSCRETEELELS